MAYLTMKAHAAGEDPASGDPMGAFPGLDEAAAFARAELVSVFNQAKVSSRPGTVPEPMWREAMADLWRQMAIFWACYEVADGSSAPADGQDPESGPGWLPFDPSDFGHIEGR